MLNSKQIVWLNRLDWITAFASLGYGIYTESWIWLAFGILAVPLAWWNPTAKFHAYTQNKLIKKRGANQWRTSQMRPGSSIKEKSNPNQKLSFQPYMWKVPPLKYDHKMRDNW